MKKLVSILLCAVLLLSLCACGEKPQQTDPQDTQTNTEATQPSQTESQATEATEESTEASVVDLKALAESCIDKTVEELFALVGEPLSSVYAPSCLNPGVGEDGNHYYEDFTVYTYKEDGKEVVTYVE